MQLSFLDTAEARLLELSRHGDPLERLNQVIDWQIFAPILAQIKPTERKSQAGRPRTESILLFKILILKKLYALSDDAVEYQIRDRLSFMRFLGLKLSSKIPDAKTIWLFANTLAQAGLAEPLFERFNTILHVLGVQMQSGQLIDASFIDVPKQRNTREENELIKQDAAPLDWQNEPALLQDAQSGGEAVYADSAYKSDEIDGILFAKGLNNKIHERGYRNKPLTDAQIAFLAQLAAPASSSRSVA